MDKFKKLAGIESSNPLYEEYKNLLHIHETVIKKAVSSGEFEKISQSLKEGTLSKETESILLECQEKSLNKRRMMLDEEYPYSYETKTKLQTIVDSVNNLDREFNYTAIGIMEIYLKGEAVSSQSIKKALAMKLLRMKHTDSIKDVAISALLIEKNKK